MQNLSETGVLGSIERGAGEKCGWTRGEEGEAREEANRGGRDERGINSLSGPSLIAYNYDYEVPEARGVERTAKEKDQRRLKIHSRKTAQRSQPGDKGEEGGTQGARKPD